MSLKRRNTQEHEIFFIIIISCESDILKSMIDELRTLNSYWTTKLLSNIYDIIFIYVLKGFDIPLEPSLP